MSKFRNKLEQHQKNCSRCRSKRSCFIACFYLGLAVGEDQNNKSKRIEETRKTDLKEIEYKVIK